MATPACARPASRRASAASPSLPTRPPLAVWATALLTVAKKALICQCGQPALTVLLVTVGGEDARYQERMPLCRFCLRLEQQMWSGE